METLHFFTLYWSKKSGRSQYWYIGSLHILTDAYNTALTTRNVVRKVLFPTFSRGYIPTSHIWIGKKDKSSADI